MVLGAIIYFLTNTDWWSWLVAADASRQCQPLWFVCCSAGSWWCDRFVGSEHPESSCHFERGDQKLPSMTWCQCFSCEKNTRPFQIIHGAGIPRVYRWIRRWTVVLFRDPSSALIVLLSYHLSLTRRRNELQSAANLGQSQKPHRHGLASSAETQSRAKPLLQH